MADKGLKLGLRTEYEAVYAYSLAGAQLTGKALEAAQSNEKVHRDRRDDIMVRMTKAGDEPPAEEAAYQLPGEVTDEKSAKALLSEIELRTTSMWRSVLADTTGGDRKAAAKAYSSSAVTMARWKRALGESPSTTAFPGRPLCFPG
ncbi:ferritin-like domain-containing protein [Stackebrandtia nassauensis]|uniref:DUF4439 domain-containing protein n=1 Tax=Stackebrandtia nassauensis (strain DSM 44728 / CIP 108903 / NRRL B-16338 / NBRC 102104 / LLR-40K-21) TaxID=446470 RepID=D3PV70_STANL|nr:ferritin-like domain-containing protein [Stackebrandtia nassauensis]ADD41123.1 conserved hypothetical protein [Stackebrandtia nassauensis DSM 44728]